MINSTPKKDVDYEHLGSTSDDQPENSAAKGLTTFEGSISLMSVMVGGGIVGIPSAMFVGGLTFGLSALLTSACLSLGSGYLILKGKLMCSVRVDTLYELCFVALGRWSIFLLSLVSTIYNGGLCIIYFILCSDIA